MRRTAGVTAERCGLAFGDLPADTAPGIDIFDKIQLGGATISTLGELDADAATEHKIPRLQAALEAPRGSAPVVVRGR